MTNVAIRSRSQLGRILMLGLLVQAIVLAGGVGALAFATRSADRAVVAEERNLVAHTLDRRLEKLIEDVTSATVRDDAYVNIVRRYDADWADENFGVYYANYMRHDRTLVFGPEGGVIYASDGGEATTPSALAAFAADVSPMVARARIEDARKAAGGPGPRDGLAAATTSSMMIKSQGVVWLVSLASVTPETTEVAMTGGPTAMVVSARRVDAGFLKELERDLGISGARLLPPGAAPTGVAVPLIDPERRVLGRVGWRPKEPGKGILGDIAVPILLVLAAFAVAAGVLVRRVFAVLRTLAVNDARLDAMLDDLTRARDRAEAASVAKSQFLANISHEIRTPLNGVLGMAQIMDRGELEPTQRRHLGIIRESGATLLTLLNDVLDLAKIEAGKLEIDRQDVDLSAAVASTCGAFMAMAHEKKLKLGFAIEPSAAGTWRLDGLRLGQVLGNLISNAVKFTAKGHVSVRVWKSARGLEFAVLDTGDGISPERLAGLWGKFNQLDATTTHRFGGTGLGLAICRELIELMGGEASVESVVGEGSYFSFFLPAEPGQGRIAA
jgi:signal transduction histidine kinase